MKSQYYKLNIDNPCSRDWSDMTPVENGKFCSFCTKTVIDFSTLTDNEIVQFIEQNKGRLCGRLTKYQLNRLLNINQRSSNKKIHKMIAGLLLVVSTESSFVNDNISSKKELLAIDDSSVKSVLTTNINVEIKTDSLKNIIKGVIVEQHTTNAIAAASISIKNTKTGVITDSVGTFNLVIPDSLLTDQVHLEVTCIGFEKKELMVKEIDLPLTKNLVMIPDEDMLIGEVVIMNAKKWWQFWK